MTWEGLTPPYRTIVADPPWHYDGRVIEWGVTKTMPYSTMSPDEIRGLDVAALTCPGGHLYLWTTNRYIEVAHHIARGWGFNPITVLVWCKEPHGLGPGGRFSITTEFVLFCRDTRRGGAALQAAREQAGLSRADVHRTIRGGKPTGIVYRWEADDCLPLPEDWRQLQALLPALANVPYPEVVQSEQGKVDTTWFRWPRSFHSVKPAAFLDVVEKVSPGPYLELFARSPRLGWDSWGYGWEQAS